MEDAVERGSSPVLAWQREDSPQVVEGDVTLWEGALQPGFLEGGPLLLKGPGTSQIPLERGHIRSFKWQTQPQEWNGIMAVATDVPDVCGASEVQRAVKVFHLVFRLN